MLWTAHRGARLRLDLDLGPLLRRHRPARRRRLPGGGRDARRAGLPDRAGASAARSCTRSATATRRCWPRRSRRIDLSSAGGRRWASAPAGPRSSTGPTASTSRRPAPAWTSSRRASPSCAACSATRSPRSTGTWFDVTERPQRASPGAGRAADLGRRWRRAAHAAHRRPLRRRVERAVRRARDVRRQARRAAPPLRRRRPRPGEIRCAVNVGLAWTEDSLRQQFGATAEMVRAQRIVAGSRSISSQWRCSASRLRRTSGRGEGDVPPVGVAGGDAQACAARRHRPPRSAARPAPARVVTRLGHVKPRRRRTW